MDQDATPEIPPPEVEDRPRFPRGILLGVGLLVLGFILVAGPVLIREMRGLRQDWEITRRGVPLAFVDISPNPTYAEPPGDWALVEGNSLRLWSGWTHGVGHGWFEANAADIPPETLSLPIGRDVTRAIDLPLVEIGEGPHWKRMLDDTPVVPLELGGAATAYPLILLQKVEVVNDTVGARPIALIFTPFLPENQAVHAYDPVVEDVVLTFGTSGHFRREDRHPLLYDRQTKGLWLADAQGLRCLSGRFRGKVLPTLASPSSTDWTSWSASHPRGRLVVGADRGKPPTFAFSNL